jgi:hypothetical protein
LDNGAHTRVPSGQSEALPIILSGRKTVPVSLKLNCNALLDWYARRSLWKRAKKPFGTHYE